MNILVDSSVWIDYFNGRVTWQTDFLDHALGWEPIIVGDLIVTEVLQGFSHREEFELAHHALKRFPIVQLVNPDLAVKSALNYQLLRREGMTVRKTIDCWIATYCIDSGTALLHGDRDFEPFAIYLGLQTIVERRE